VGERFVALDRYTAETVPVLRKAGGSACKPLKIKGEMPAFSEMAWLAA